MISFEHLCADIKLLVGKKICSIKPGSNLIVKKIDKNNKTIEILDKEGTSKTRPISELQKIWLELRNGRPIHVDSVLGGSGSSRNQPETVLANLPYVEWLFINGKKHLILFQEKTHEIGTLKKMDPLKVQGLVSTITEKKEPKINSIIIFEDILKGAQILAELTFTTPLPICEGIYSLKTFDQNILLVSEKEINPNIACASYPVVYGSRKELKGISFSIREKKYQLISILGNKVIYSSE